MKIGWRWSLLLFGLLMLSSCGAPYEFRGTALEPAKPAPDFTLTDQNGLPFRLSDQRSKLTVLFFGFTTCPDICPTTLANLAAARRELGMDAEQVQVAMVTVDPERDTQDVLRRYVTTFDPTFIGLHGPIGALEPVYQAYGVTRIDPNQSHAEHNQHNQDVVHSGYIYVIDKSGQWRVLLHEDDTVADIASDLRHLVGTS